MTFPHRAPGSAWSAPFPRKLYCLWPPARTPQTVRKRSACCRGARRASHNGCAWPRRSTLGCRKLVVEAVEIDAFAAFHQSVYIGATKIEVPEHGALDDLVPRADAGQWCVDDCPLGDTVGILRGERVADHVADIVRHQIGFLHIELVHHRYDVDGFGFLVIAALRLGRE